MMTSSLRDKTLKIRCHQTVHQTQLLRELTLDPTRDYQPQ